MDLTGMKFGNLTVISRDYTKPARNYKTFWKCLCDCGKETIVSADKLRGGHTKSCGHIMGENIKKAAREKAALNNKIIRRYDNYSEISLNGIKTLIDNQFLDEVMKWNWLVSKAGYLFRHVYRGKTVWLHRFVMNLPPKELTVDHKNHEKSDNRCENLRICSSTENARNTVLRTNSKTGYKGVCAINNRFYAKINVCGKKIHLGTYDTAERAHEAYRAAAKRYFGEFACTG